MKELSGGKPWGVYDDFRAMIEKEKLDAVMVETTTHARAWIAIHAMQMGMDTYIEKPMCLTIAEGREMVNAARKYEHRDAGRDAAAFDADQQLGQRPGEERRVGQVQDGHRTELRRTAPLDRDHYGGRQGTGGALVGPVDQPGRTATARPRGCSLAGPSGGITTAAACASASPAGAPIRTIRSTAPSAPTTPVRSKWNCWSQWLSAKPASSLRGQTVGGVVIGDTGDIDTGTDYHGMAKLTGPRARCR